MTLGGGRRGYGVGLREYVVHTLRRWSGPAAVLVWLAFVSSSFAAGTPGHRRSAGVVFRAAEKPVGRVPSEIADRVRGPENHLWVIYHADWASGSDVLDLHVTPDVDLRLSMAASVFRDDHAKVPSYVGVFIDGKLFAVGTMSRGTRENEIVLKGLPPERAVVLANKLGATGAMAAGPRLSVSPQTTSMPPGGRMTVDVYVSGIPDIALYHVVLRVKNGLRGAFLIEDARINRTRSDFVFARAPEAQTSVELKVAGVSGSALHAQVDPTRSSYLGTIVFRALANAEGTFTIWINEEASELRDADGRSLPFRAGAASIVVGKHLAPRWQH